MLTGALTAFSNPQDIIALLMLVIELLGVILVIVTLRKDKKIKQAEFIMNYNFQFISSDSLVEMERKLENCYQIYKTHVTDYKSNSLDVQVEEYRRVWHLMEKQIGFGPVSASSTPVTKDYQKLINYLVYLESFAPLILTGQVELKDIDDTFGYRYFIAMNNPVVQKYELLPEADYYCGCIRLYKKWYNYRKGRGKAIPMEWYALSNIGGGQDCSVKNPVYQFDNRDELLNTYKRVTKRS